VLSVLTQHGVDDRIIDEYATAGRMKTGTANQNTREICRSATSSTTNPIWLGLE
jgi:hypothetical protein